MTFDQAYWRNPRATIATKFQNNDIAYATHGAQQALYALRKLDLRPSEAERMTALDIGCGTGRMARVLAFLFDRVVAYDPVVECIAAARVECKDLLIPNLTYETNPAKLPVADVAVCINVIEHLDDPRAQALLTVIESHLKPGGRYVLWYAIHGNSDVLGHRLTPEMRAEDEKLVATADRSLNVRVFHT